MRHRPARWLALVAVAAAVCLVPPPVRAQDPDFDVPGADEGPLVTQPDREREPPSALALALVGTASGMVGFLGGFAIGVEAGEGEGTFDGLDTGIVVGSVVGGLTLPLGVHGANGGHGDLPLVLVTSILTGGAGWLLAASADDAHIVLATPLLQLAGCTVVEVSTDPRRRRESGPAARAAAAPRVGVGLGRLDGRPALLVGGRF